MSKIKLHPLDWSKIHSKTSNESLQIVKTIKGLCKLLLIRRKLLKIREYLEYIDKSYESLVETKNTLYKVMILVELTSFELQNTPFAINPQDQNKIDFETAL